MRPNSTDLRLLRLIKVRACCICNITKFVRHYFLRHFILGLLAAMTHTDEQRYVGWPRDLEIPFSGRLRRIDLIKWVSDVRLSVRTTVRPSVRTYVRPSTKSFSDSDENWYVGRGRWVMHDGLPYDPIQSQGQGHETFKVRDSSIFFNFLQFSKSISSGIFNVSWQMTTDSETMEQCLNFVWTRFLISVLVFVSREYEVGRVSYFGGVDRQSRTGLIFLFLMCIILLVNYFFLFSWRTLLERCHVNHWSPGPQTVAFSLQTRGRYSVASNPPQLQWPVSESSCRSLLLRGRLLDWLVTGGY